MSLETTLTCSIVGIGFIIGALKGFTNGWDGVLACGLIVAYLLLIGIPVILNEKKSDQRIRWAFIPTIVIFPALFQVFPAVGWTNVAYISGTGCVVFMLASRSSMFRKCLEHLLNGI